LIVDLLREIAMEEGVLHVELMHWPVTSSSKVQHGANGCWLDNRREGLVEVEAGALREVTDNPTRFATLQGAIGMEFVLENPFASDHMSTGWTRYKFPCPIAP